MMDEVELPLEDLPKPKRKYVRKPKPETDHAAPKPPVEQYRALRRLVVGDKTYAPGDVVPEANSWLRLEAWEKARYVEKVA